MKFLDFVRRSISKKREDNVTRLYITLDANTGLDFYINGDQYESGIDWGDGTVSYDMGFHTYQQYGSYVVKIIGKLEIKQGYDRVFSPGAAVTAVELADNALGVGAFRGCVNLSSVTLSGTETEIPDEAFRGCGLESMPLNENIRSIGYGAFIGCPLNSFVIPAYVTSIGSFAFSGVSTNKFITITIAPVASGKRDLSASNIFEGASVRTMYLPKDISAIGSRFLYNNYGGVDVYYNGTYDDFQEINYAPDWAGSGVNIHYTDD